MEKEIISSKQGITLLIMYILGSSLILSPGRNVGRDAWIAVLFAMFITIPILYIYTRLVTVCPGRDFFDLQKILFGKVIGTITTLLFVLYCLHLGSMILRNFSEFIQAVSFPETPQLFTLIIMGTVCIFGAKCGIEVLARWSSFIFPVFFLTVIFLITFSIPNAELANVKPILFNGLDPVVKSSIPIFAFPFAEVAVFTTLFSSLHNKRSTYKIFLIGTVISGLMLSAVSVRNIAVLGAESIASYYFPTYNAVSVISIGSFFDRFEILVAVMFILSGFLKATVCLYSASKGFSKIFKVSDYSQFAAPLGILMFTAASFAYQNIMEMFKWAGEVYQYYAFPFVVLLPLVTLAFAEGKAWKMKKEAKE